MTPCAGQHCWRGLLHPQEYRHGYAAVLHVLERFHFTEPGRNGKSLAGMRGNLRIARACFAGQAQGFENVRLERIKLGFTVQQLLRYHGLIRHLKPLTDWE